MYAFLWVCFFFVFFMLVFVVLLDFVCFFMYVVSFLSFLFCFVLVDCCNLCTTVWGPFYSGSPYTCPPNPHSPR